MRLARVWRSARCGSSWQEAQMPVNLRRLKQDRIRHAREKIFGVEAGMPGDRHLRRPLEGRELQRWYFPSKFDLQDFRVSEYFEMQAERHAPRETHRCVPQLQALLQKVLARREELRAFFGRLDEETFYGHPSLQDLYGLFRLVDPDKALPFEVDERAFKEHDPLFGTSPPLRITTSSGDDAGTSRDLESEESHREELQALKAFMRQNLAPKQYLDLDAELSRARTLGECQELLLGAAARHGVPAPFAHTAVVVEEEEVAAAKPPVDSASTPAPADETSNVGNMSEYLGEREESDSDKNSVAKEAEQSEPQKPGRRKRLATYLVRKQSAPMNEEHSENALCEAQENFKQYLNRRHRFIDPMYRRRRLKWLERQMSQKNKDREVKFNPYWMTHPDDHKMWPTNKGSTTVIWPSPYH